MADEPNANPTGDGGNQPPAKPSITLPTGQTYTGESWEEVAQRVADAQTEASRTIQDRERQIYELRQTQAQPKAESKVNAFDPNKFYEKLGSGTVEGISEALNYADKYRYGIDGDPAEAVRYAYNMTRRMADQQAVAVFHQNVPEYPQSDSNAAALMTKRLNDEGLPITATTLEATFRQLVREGTIKPIEVQHDDTPPRSRGERAPTVDRKNKGDITDDFINSFENMSLEEMDKELRKRNMKW